MMIPTALGGRIRPIFSGHQTQLRVWKMFTSVKVWSKDENIKVMMLGEIYPVFIESIFLEHVREMVEKETQVIFAEGHHVVGFGRFLRESGE